jgi:hypothetical protein
MAEYGSNQHQNDCKNDSNNQNTYSSDWINKINEYTVYWLDEQQNDPLHGYKISPSKLRGIIDYLQCFTQIDICVENIRKINDQKVFIIVISSACLQLLNQIHNLPQVHSIYIYRNSTDEEVSPTIFDSNTFDAYKKVRSVRYSFIIF